MGRCALQCCNVDSGIHADRFVPAEIQAMKMKAADEVFSPQDLDDIRLSALHEVSSTVSGLIGHYLMSQPCRFWWVASRRGIGTYLTNVNGAYIGD